MDARGRCTILAIIVSGHELTQNVVAEAEDLRHMEPAKPPATESHSTARSRGYRKKLGGNSSDDLPTLSFVEAHKQSLV